MRALAFGEILWDIIDGTPHLGGAPFNLTAHLAKMGAKAAIVSSVGTDELGDRAIEAAASYGIDTSMVARDPDRPTGWVDVFLDGAGHPDYTIHENVAWDLIPAPADPTVSLGGDPWDVFSFGTLAQRSDGNRAVLIDLIDTVGAAEVFYDVNLRQQFFEKGWIESSLRRSSIVKLNDDEAVFLSDYLFGSSHDEVSFVGLLAERFNLRIVILSRGSKGALVFDEGSFHETTCQDVDVADTVGAGDSFSAGFLHALLGGRSAFEAAEFAGRIADYVVTQTGAIPDYPQSLAAEIASFGRSE